MKRIFWRTTLAGVGVIGAVSTLMGGCATDAETSTGRTYAQESGMGGTDGGECLVGDEAIEHTCGHTQFGPFASVAAQPFPGTPFSAINSPHTAYSVTLPGASPSYHGQVVYQPATTGAFGFFLAPEVELSLFDSLGQLVVPVGEQPVDPSACATLSSVVVYQLDEVETYSVVFGPSPASSVLTIVEYLGLEPSCEGCEHVELEASLTRRPLRRDDGVVQLDHPVTFEVPSSLELVEGQSPGSLVSLRFRHDGSSVARCLYRGGRSTPESLELVRCTGGFSAGDDVEADFFRLRVEAARCTSLRVALEIHPEACDDHDDHDGEEH